MATREEEPPLNAEVMGKFQEMFADLLLEVKEGRLSQEEGMQLKESLDRIGHWEYGHGEGPRQREPLSAWINRTVQRIKGDIVYKTKYQHGGSSCTCAAE